MNITPYEMEMLRGMVADNLSSVVRQQKSIMPYVIDDHQEMVDRYDRLEEKREMLQVLLKKVS